MHRHPQSDRARHPPRHRQRRPRRQTGGDYGRPSRRRRHRHGGPRRSGAASRCPRRRRRLGGPHGVRTGTLRTRHRTRRVHGADTVARRRSGLVARSRRRAVRPGVDPPRLSGPRRCGCARRQGPRQPCRLSIRARHRRDRADHPRDRTVPRPGPHHRCKIRRCVDRSWLTASATCSRRARSSGWR